MSMQEGLGISSRDKVEIQREEYVLCFLREQNNNMWVNVTEGRFSSVLERAF